MYEVRFIAHFIIDYFSRIGKPISNLKLQKILYFLWIDYYKNSHDYLFDEEFYAWQFGPVIPEVYDEYCTYGGFSIDRRYEEHELSAEDEKLLPKFLKKYQNQSVGRLVERSHQRGKPWDYVYNQLGQFRAVIPFDIIVKKECE